MNIMFMRLLPQLGIQSYVIKLYMMVKPFSIEVLIQSSFE